jgi:hypothetical protein
MENTKMYKKKWQKIAECVKELGVKDYEVRNLEKDKKITSKIVKGEKLVNIDEVREVLDGKKVKGDGTIAKEIEQEKLKNLQLQNEKLRQQIETERQAIKTEQHHEDWAQMLTVLKIVKKSLNELCDGKITMDKLNSVIDKILQETK